VDERREAELNLIFTGAPASPQVPIPAGIDLAWRDVYRGPPDVTAWDSATCSPSPLPPLLRVGGVYAFRVAAWNSMGLGRFSPPVAFRKTGLLPAREGGRAYSVDLSAIFRGVTHCTGVDFHA